MARTLSNVEYQIANLRSTALTSIGRDATRRYLRLQLLELDVQIEALIYVQTQEAWRMLERAAWMQPAAAKVIWTGRLELHYLQAVREAVVETLARL